MIDWCVTDSVLITFPQFDKVPSMEASGDATQAGRPGPPGMVTANFKLRGAGIYRTGVSGPVVQNQPAGAAGHICQ